jgi:hypothetical protein
VESGAETYWPTRWRFAAAILLLCWVLSFLGPLSYLIFFVLGFAVMRAIYRKAWLPLLLLIAANTFTAFFAGGAVDYTKGSPALRGMGLPGFEYFNIDPKTRCMRRSGGCVVSGNEWVSNGFHNLGVQSAVAVFGYPSRSYDGPYPSKEQALREISNAADLPLDEFRQGIIEIENRVIQLDSAMIHDWAMMAGIFELMDGMEPEPDHGVQVKAVFYQERCLILRLIQKQPQSVERQDFIILLDARNKRPFAYHCIEGSPLGRVPRVQYLPRTPR